MRTGGENRKCERERERKREREKKMYLQMQKTIDIVIGHLVKEYLRPSLADIFNFRVDVLNPEVRFVVTIVAPCIRQVRDWAVSELNNAISFCVVNERIDRVPYPSFKPVPKSVQGGWLEIKKRKPQIRHWHLKDSLYRRW